MGRSCCVSAALVLCALGACLAPARGHAAEAVSAESPNRSAAIAATPVSEFSPRLRRMAWLACRVRHPSAPYLLCDAPIYAEQARPLPARLDRTVEPSAPNPPGGSPAPERADE